MGYLKECWGEMGWGRRIVLLIQPAMSILCSIVYLIVFQQRVVPYGDGFLRCEQQGDTAVYSGRQDGRSIQYSVPSGRLVEFWLDGALEGAYTIEEDPTALPDQEPDIGYSLDRYTGVEIQRDGRVWFRGAYSSPDSLFWLLDEEGNVQSVSPAPFPVQSKPDPAPSPGDILSFANGPKIHRRGNGLFLLLGLFSNAVCALSLLFEDQLFRWQLSFRVADPGSAEPSEWEMFNRWAGWIVLTAVALLVYTGAAGLI